MALAKEHLQTMIDINDLINPINLNKLDTNEINFFSGIPDLYFDDQNRSLQKKIKIEQLRKETN